MKIAFQLIGKNDLKHIYVRITDFRTKLKIRTNTGSKCHIDNWRKGLPTRTTQKLIDLNTELNDIESLLLEKIEEARREELQIDQDWLKNRIDKYNGIIEDNNLSYLSNYIADYYSNIKVVNKKLTEKQNKGRKSASTKNKYKTLMVTVLNYEKFKNRTYKVYQVDEKFKNSFEDYLIEEHSFSTNTIYSIVNSLNTACRSAILKNIKVSPELIKVKTDKKKAEAIAFTQEELNRIWELKPSNQFLVNAQDWMKIGVIIGQRVGDLLSLTSDNIINREGKQYLKITQQKTKKKIIILIGENLKTILNKHDGFPPRMNEQRFNERIRELSQMAQISEEIETSLYNRDKKRKITGIYKKHQVVSSHTLRKTFCTINYNKPNVNVTNLCRISGHSSEKMLQIYIDWDDTKTADDFGEGNVFIT